MEVDGQGCIPSIDVVLGALHSRNSAQVPTQKIRNEFQVNVLKMDLGS